MRTLYICLLSFILLQILQPNQFDVRSAIKNWFRIKTILLPLIICCKLNIICLCIWKLLLAECEDGTFGKDCTQTCSGNCKDNETCNSANGHCLRGCVSGYIGNFCNKCIHLKDKRFLIKIL